MHLPLRTIVTNTTEAVCGVSRPVRLSWWTNYGYTLCRHGDTLIIPGHAESLVNTDANRRALAFDVERGQLALRHEVQLPDGTWVCVEDLISEATKVTPAPSINAAPPMELGTMSFVVAPEAPALSSTPEPVTVPEVIQPDPPCVAEPVVTPTPAAVEPVLVEEPVSVERSFPGNLLGSEGVVPEVEDSSADEEPLGGFSERRAVDL